MHFVIIIVSYLALIRLLFVELGFCQIKRRCIKYNNHASFHLWGKKHSVKYQKASKYYEHDCNADSGINLIIGSSEHF